MNDLYKEINLNYLIDNYEYIKNASKKEVIPVIKSNAYGCGSVEVAKKLQSNNIHLLAVVDVSEAIELINNDINCDILILNGITDNNYDILNNHNIVLSINSIKDMKILDKYYNGFGLKLHFQIETGMSRLGILTLEELNQCLEIAKNGKYIIEGIYTHFTDCDNILNQEKKFLPFVEQYPFNIIHCASSSSYNISTIGNYVRAGIALYGSENNPNLKQIIKVVTKPINIKYLEYGDTLGYGRSYRTFEKIRMAVLPIGYANGFSRKLIGFYVLCNGKKYKIIGRICMNHTFILIDDNVNMDSEIIITSNELKAHKIADYLDTISYEILCNLNMKINIYI